MSIKGLLIFILIIIGLGYYYYDHYIYFENLDTSLEPIQINLEESKKIEGERNGVKFQVETKAEYEIEALLISKEKYNSWEIAQVVPYDLALVWGDLAKEENIKNLDYGQNLRFVRWRYDGKMKLSDLYIKSHISNNHVIPANEKVYEVLKNYKPNRVIHLKGYLVKVYIYSENNPENYWSMDSSMIREDTGDGACEVMYVEKAW